MCTHNHNLTRRLIHTFIMSNSCKCIGVNGEALRLHSVYVFLQVTQESISVLQVKLESVSDMQVTCAASERAMKSKVRMIKS